MTTRVGEIAALATAVSWTITALFFEYASKRIGSIAVNVLRLGVAFGLFALYGTFVRGLWLPSDASGHTWLWLSLSGLVGFTFGDLCLFEAYVLIGARLSLLALSLVPPIVTLLGMLLLGEHLAAGDWLGMLLTVSGVAWVVGERQPRGDEGQARRRGIGILLALGGALGQAGGLILSKIGMRDYDAFAATHIRVIAGSLGFAALYSVAGWWPRIAAGLRDRVALAHMSLGAFFGPFLGVGLSLLAIQHTQTGVAATIMALTPVLVLPTVRLVHHEHVSLRATLGTVLAFLGVAILFR